MGKSGNETFSQFYAPHLGKSSERGNPSHDRLAQIERMYYRVLTELCVNRFKWIGLPDTVDERFLEMTLFYRGLAVFYWDTEFSRYLTLRAGAHGRTNMYDNPTSFTVMGGGAMINKVLGPKECVPIWSNYMRVPDLDIVQIYATKFADLDRTIEINSHNMRYAKAVNADENSVKSWKNVMHQYDGGEPLLLGTLGMNFEAATTLDLGVPPETLEKLLTAKSKLWNECMTLLGINNNPSDKKERLVADEVKSNEGQIVASRSINMNARMQAAALINRMYPDLDVRVTFRTEDEVMPQPQGFGELHELESLESVIDEDEE